MGANVYVRKYLLISARSRIERGLMPNVSFFSNVTITIFAYLSHNFDFHEKNEIFQVGVIDRH